MLRTGTPRAVLAAIFIVSATLIPPTATASEPTAVSQSGLSAIDHAVQFRATSGFRSDRQYVDASFVDARTFPNWEYGLPLTSAEAAEVARRIAVQLKVDRVIDDVADLPDFAGVYSDLPAGGVPVFLVTRSDSPIGAKVSELLAGVASPRIEVVKYSRHDLESIKARIWADRDGLRAAGIVIQSAALDIAHNRVVVGVLGLTANMASTLVERYDAVQAVDEPVDNEMDTCNSVDDCYPMKGGLRIREVGHPSSYCTSGFNVRLSNTSTFRVLTAGHCLGKALNGPTGAWTHGGTEFGSGTYNTWTTGSDADAGLISQANPTVDNQLFGTSTSDIRTVGGYVTTASQNQNDYLCRQGATSGFWCGNIALEDKSKDVDGRTIDHQWVVNFDAIAGDSGGPYFTTSSGVTLAWGIHSDSTSANPPGGSAWYSPMQWVFSVLSAANHPISLCTSQYCGL